MKSSDTTSLWILLALVMALLIECMAHGQVPPPGNPRIVTNYYAAIALDGTNASAPSNEVAVTNREFTLSFSPSPGVLEVVGQYDAQGSIVWTTNLIPKILSNGIAVGRSPGVYTRTNYIGTNCSMRFPIPITNVVAAAYGGTNFYTETNPVLPVLFLKAMPVNETWTSIQSATNLNGPWTLFRFAGGSNLLLTCFTYTLP